MFLFKVHYVNMETGEEITRDICFEDYYSSEKESFIFAMSRAYDLKKENECFCSIEFITC